jgi:hypothetical protein
MADVEAGKAFVRLYLKGDVSKDLQQMGAKLKRWGAGIQLFSANLFKAGALMLAPFATAIAAASKPGHILANTMAKLRETTGRVSDSIARALLPLIKQVVDKITEWSVTVRDWIAENGELVRTIFKVALGVMAAASALLVIGKIVTTIGLAFGALSAIIAGILSPIGLVVVAIAGAIAAWAAWTEEGKKFLGSIRSAWGGIVDAVKAGDLQLAAEIAWLGIKVAFFQIVDALRVKWLEFSRWFMDSILALGQRLAGGIPGLDEWAAQIKEFRRLVNEEYDRDIAAGTARLAAMERELATLRGKAAMEAAYPEDKRKKKPGGDGDELPYYFNQSGTFSAAAARIMFQAQSEKYASRTAEATEETVRILKRRSTVVAPTFAP